MPYIHAETKAGKTIMVEKYYSSRYRKQGIERSNNIGKTPEEQEQVNLNKAIRSLALLMNANFESGDYHLVLNYRKEERPKTSEDAKRDRERFLRCYREECKKLGVKYKYIICTEYGKRGALHHHVIINKIDPTVFTKCWKKGRPTFTMLEPEGEYSQLATYFLKGRKYWKKNGGKGRQYSPSRGLVRPITKKRIIRSANGYYETPRERKGYYIKKETQVNYIHESGYPYMRYTLVETGEIRRRAP